MRGCLRSCKFLAVVAGVCEDLLLLCFLFCFLIFNVCTCTEERYIFQVFQWKKWSGGALVGVILSVVDRKQYSLKCQEGETAEHPHPSFSTGTPRNNNKNTHKDTRSTRRNKSLESRVVTPQLASSQCRQTAKETLPPVEFPLETKGWVLHAVTYQASFPGRKILRSAPRQRPAHTPAFPLHVCIQNHLLKI